MMRMKDLTSEVDTVRNQFYIGTRIGIVGIIAAVVALAIRRRP